MKPKLYLFIFTFFAVLMVACRTAKKLYEKGNYDEAVQLAAKKLQKDPDDPKSPIVKDPRIFINPEILWHSDHEVPYTEGCLSVPEQYAEVMRPDKIRARWQDVTGKAYEEDIDGLLAVCLQHEMDHLEGVLFIDHLSRLKRDMVLKKLAKWRKEQGLKAA